ncbi:MAG: 2-hydroxyglutaryl-CoA dehydratase, partial [Acidaminobacter sp.]|nr:2-hydroxyglutaryl-CoA dehydratase [Acidaminobacter sp.]
MIHMGIDIGSVCAKGAILCDDRLEKVILPTGWNIKETASLLKSALLSSAGATDEEVARV